jgi:hypothetical protein
MFGSPQTGTDIKGRKEEQNYLQFLFSKIHF